MKNMLATLFNRSDSEALQNAIIIAPQCPYNNQWVDTPWADGNYDIDSVPESNELKALVELLNKIKKDYSTDEDRYYAIGLSMGGFGTWDLLMRHSDMFAAGVPVCGGADLEMAELLMNIPVYTGHGKWDDIVPFNDSTKAVVQAIKNAGGTSIIYKEYSGGHLIWDNLANEADLFDWLFAQKKSDIVLKENELPPVGENPFS